MRWGNCAVVWAFFGIAFLSDWNENWPFPSPVATAEFSILNILDSYTILFFAASDSLQHRILLSSSDTSTAKYHFCFGLAASFFPKLFLHSFLCSNRISANLGVHISVSYLFAFSYCSWGSQGKNTEVVCHSLLQGTAFCQNSPLWPVHLGWPYMARPIVSFS